MNVNLMKYLFNTVKMKETKISFIRQPTILAKFLVMGKVFLGKSFENKITLILLTK